MRGGSGPGLRWLGRGLGAAMVLLLALPVVGLLWVTGPRALWDGLRAPAFWPALWLSLRTSALSLLLVVLLGTPLAWWLAWGQGRARRWLSALTVLPVVMPPAVVGIGLLAAFGRGGPLAAVGLPFTGGAVVLAQLIVAAPLYLQAAQAVFRRVDPDLLVVARSLGASPAQAAWTVGWPLARPGLLLGAGLAWARALGEFGATLLFAGNLPGRTQTLPLAIFSALERDVSQAVVFALALGGLGVVVLGAVAWLWGGDREAQRSAAQGSGQGSGHG